MLLLSTYSIMIPSVTGFADTWTKTYETAKGTSTYTLVLETPDEVSNNSNWTITTSLLVDHMDTHKQYIFFSTIEITAETASGESMKKIISFGTFPIGEFPQRIYTGGRWGPNTITFDLSNGNLTVPFAGSTEVTLYVTVTMAEFIHNPFIAEQLPTTTFESFSIVAGTVRIMSDSDFLTDYLSYILGAVVSITIFIGLVLRDRRTVN
jgi:hypothetical protein|tara:strand:+ start:314 stop:937 length:624 start_codon:yes stop_codon:yes gene_type:complete